MVLLQADNAPSVDMSEVFLEMRAGMVKDAWEL
jgi:hypothetical protein